MSSNMTKVAVLDDWQGVARQSADWSKLEARAQVTFFQDAFADENDAAAKLADFDIVLSMRERTPLAASLINRLPKLRMMGMTGARNAGASLITRETSSSNLERMGHDDWPFHRSAMWLDTGLLDTAPQV